jgi:hypothetical protein
MRPYVFIPSIVTPASSYNLVDLATVKTLLGITTTAYDAALNLWIPQASATAQSWCNNPFVIETIEDQLWPGSDGWPWTVSRAFAPLQLSRWPIVAISSVVETICGVATTLTLGTDFVADTALGQLTRLNTYGSETTSPPVPCNWRANPIVAQYQAGYATIPGDVFAAVVHLVKLEYYSQSRDPLVRSQNSPGVYEASYVMGTGPGGPGDLDAYAASKLERYRVPVIA